MRASRLFVFVLALLSAAACSHSSSYYIERGNTAFSSGKYDAALLSYRKAVDKDPKSAEAYFRMGLCQLKQSRFRESWQSLNHASELAPGRDDIEIELGNLCLLGLVANPNRPVNLYNRLKQTAATLLGKNPNSFAGLRFSGYLALFDKKGEEAVTLFRRANQLKPDEPDVALSLVEALFQNGEDEEAVKTAQSFIQLKKNHGPAYDALYAHYLSRRQTGPAEDILKLKISNNPNEPAYVTQLASFYWRLGKRTEALDLVKHLLARPSPTAATHLASGDFYGSLERWDDAAEQFREGMRLQPDQKALFQKRLANVYLAQGKRQEATSIVDELLKEQPNDREARAISAGLSVQSGKPEAIAAAITIYRQLLRENSLDPPLHYALGRALMASHDLPLAGAELREAVRLQPNHLDALNALAEIAVQEHAPEEALNWSARALDVAPQDGTARLRRAQALKASGQLDPARAELNALLRVSPSNAQALLELGLVEVERKDFRAADAAFQRLEKLDSIGAASGRATSLAAQGQASKAIEILKQTVNDAPDRAISHELLATLAMREHMPELAAQEYHALLAIDPKSTLTRMRLADAYRLQGNLNRSITELEQAVREEPENPMPKLVLAGDLTTAGRPQEALKLYRDALRLRPGEAGIQNNVAFLLVETNGDLEEATKLAQEASRKAPTEPVFRDTLGWIYVKKGMASTAIQIFENLVDKYPDEPSYRYHLGAALLKNGSKERARTTLQGALSKNPSKPDAEKIRELLASIG